MGSKVFKLGLLINPLAGLGGSVALKGSDNMAQRAVALGAKPMAHFRMRTALEAVLPFKDNIEILTGNGALGQELAQALGFNVRVIYVSQQTTTTSADTQALVALMQSDYQPDLLLFAGGDGTARDIYSVVEDRLPVLGVPAGVKIHSGVYAVTPSAAGKLVNMLLETELVSLMLADVMDIDEVAFRAGSVRAKRFGEMLVPAKPQYVQSVKMGGREQNELVLADIAADVIEQMDNELFIMGSGSTVAGVMDELGLTNTLLGVDLIQHKQLVANDLSASQLLTMTTDQPVKLVITLIGGQGHILGRGNQQLSAELIWRIGKENIVIIATKTKLKALEGRPLIVDSGDIKLDLALCGYYKVITGYHDYVMYPVANPDIEL